MGKTPNFGGNMKFGLDGYFFWIPLLFRISDGYFLGMVIFWEVLLFEWLLLWMLNA